MINFHDFAFLRHPIRQYYRFWVSMTIVRAYIWILTSSMQHELHGHANKSVVFTVFAGTFSVSGICVPKAVEVNMYMMTTHAVSYTHLTLPTIYSV